MPDTLGTISVPEPITLGTFPLQPDYGAQIIYTPQVISHILGSAQEKITQRFYIGNGAKRFRFVRTGLTDAERVLIRNFWENTSGNYNSFIYNVPNSDGTTTPYTCRFENSELAWTAISNAEFSISLMMVEIPVTNPIYTIALTVTRFPGTTLSAALASQVQEFIPLIKIQPREIGYPALFVSDRRCTVSGQLYQARLLQWDGISQSMGSESDDAQFTFGNADRVMTAVFNSTNLDLARLEFSLFHVGTSIKLDLWAGDLTDCDAGEDNEFHTTFSDGLHQLNLPFPTRRVSRTCWKDLDDGINCPASLVGGTNLGTPCDKGFNTPTGCVFHNMMPYHGGIQASPQGVITKDNSTGVHGFGRSSLTSVSLVSDTVYDEVVPVIYTNVPMPVNAKIVAGRDEGDFYTALGIVGEGPITSFGELIRPGPPITKVQHSLDGSYWHGYPRTRYGLRIGAGHDPVQDNDPDHGSDLFSLGQGGSGPQTYGVVKAAGTAFIEIRRSDEKGLQLTTIAEHAMQAIVTQGLSGWVWTAPGVRTMQVLSNPAWIVIDILLRARSVIRASAAVAEQYFDVNAAIAFAVICDTVATKLVGTGMETQFQFAGNLQESKPLRDWITEILMNASGGYSFSFGKIRLFGRFNSSTIEAYTIGNMVLGSLKYGYNKPAFNHLTANFADSEFEFSNNSVTLYDIDHAKEIGGISSPLFLKSTMNLAGTFTKSQAARLLIARLREELGGVTATERKNARRVNFRTTILGLASEVGQVDSITHTLLPAGLIEFRVANWKLNKDYSIDISGRSTTDSMYDMTMGYKPADIVASPVPIEQEFAPDDWNYEIYTDKDGKLVFSNFSCATNPNTVTQGFFDLYYLDEAAAAYSGIAIDVTALDTSITFFGAPPPEGSWITIDSEMLFVTKVTGAVATVSRGMGNSIVAAHNRVYSNISSLNAAWKAEFNVGSGKNFKPGNQIVAPDGTQSRIAEYNSTTGLLRTLLPIASLANGQQVYSDPRIWFLSLLNISIPFNPKFFKSDSRANFTYSVDLPYAGLALIDGVLQNGEGFRSLNLRKSFLVNRLRTLGTTALHFKHPSVPTGVNLDLCTPITTQESQPFEQSYAEIVTLLTLDPPRSLAAITPSYFGTGGQINLTGGAVNAGAIISVSFRGKNNITIPTWTAVSETGIATMSDVAIKLAAWLNSNPQFATFYQATASGTVVNVSDISGAGGVMAATSNVTPYILSFSGLTSQLGILTGRKYACAFTGAGLRSELSLPSYSTGPTGSATQIDISDIPIPEDARVTVIEIYAALDGTDAPFHLAGTVTPGILFFNDMLTESSLGAAAIYPGAIQPIITGWIKATIEQDANPLIELMIPVGKARSNTVNGMALTPLVAGSVFTLNVDNESNAPVAINVLIG